MNKITWKWVKRVVLIGGVVGLFAACQVDRTKESPQSHRFIFDTTVVVTRPADTVHPDSLINEKQKK